MELGESCRFSTSFVLHLTQSGVSRVSISIMSSFRHSEADQIKSESLLHSLSASIRCYFVIVSFLCSRFVCILR